MRKLISVFMMPLMVAATMTCFCPPEAHAGVSQGHSHAIQNEHVGHQHHHEKGDAPDCKGTDMQVPKYVSVSAPDLKNSTHVDFTSAVDTPAWTPVLAMNTSVRGPPPDWPTYRHAQTSILLTTQRLRI